MISPQRSKSQASVAGRRVGKRKEEKESKEPEVEIELPEGNKTHIVGDEWSKIRSINQAIQLFNDGDTIIVLPGDYYEEVVLNKENLNIKGEGDREAIVIHRGLRSSAKACSLSHVTIRGTLAVEGGAPHITDCTVLGSKHGATIHAFCSPVFRACKFQGASMACVYAYPNSRGHIEACDMEGTEQKGTVGIYTDNSSAVFKKNTIHKVEMGICASKACTGMQVLKNEITEVGGVGIHISNACTATFNNNKIAGCEYYGLVVEGNSSPILKGNEVVACRTSIKKGSNPTLKSNAFSGCIINENDITNPLYSTSDATALIK